MQIYLKEASMISVFDKNSIVFFFCFALHIIIIGEKFILPMEICSKLSNSKLHKIQMDFDEGGKW